MKQKARDDESRNPTRYTLAGETFQTQSDLPRTIAPMVFAIFTPSGLDTERLAF